MPTSSYTFILLIWIDYRHVTWLSKFKTAYIRFVLYRYITLCNAFIIGVLWIHIQTTKDFSDVSYVNRIVHRINRMYLGSVGIAAVTSICWEWHMLKKLACFFMIMWWSHNMTFRMLVKRMMNPGTKQKLVEAMPCTDLVNS